MIPEPVICLGQALDVRDLLALLFRVDHFDRQIRTIETADKGLRLVETELLNDVGANVRRGGGGECESLNLSQRLNDASQSQVVRTKVVTPG